MKPRLRTAGMALVSAIFLIVVLVALGASMANLSSVEHDTAAKSFQAAKVYYGAKSGLEWAIQQAISDPAPPARCAASTPFPSPLTVAGLQEVKITVFCEAAQYGSGTTAYTFYIRSEATIGSAPGTLGYAERRMAATVANIP